MPTPLNMPVILIGTPFVEQAHQQVVQQGEQGVRDGIRRVDQLIDQERTEVQQLLPTDNPAIQEKAGGNPKRRRRGRRESVEAAVEEEEKEVVEAKSGTDGRGKKIDIKA